MTKLEQAARQALEALEYAGKDDFWRYQDSAITALREALAEPAEEPVAWKNAAIRLGEELSSVGPDGYYDMTAQQWLDWAMDQQPQGKNSLPITPKPAAQMPHYSNTDNPVDFPRLGCVNHDCAACKEKKALAKKRIDYRAECWPESPHLKTAKHQEELNKFAEDSVWDGEGP